MAEELEKAASNTEKNISDLLNEMQSDTKTLATQLLKSKQNESTKSGGSNELDINKLVDNMEVDIYAVFTNIKKNLTLSEDKDADSKLRSSEEMQKELKKLNELMLTLVEEKKKNESNSSGSEEKDKWFDIVGLKDLDDLCSQILSKWLEWDLLKKIKFTILSPVATVENDVLVKDLVSEEKEIGKLFSANFKKGNFFRTIKSDYELANCMYDELVLRGVKPGNDHIVLISEWDTDYGSALPLSYDKVFKDRCMKGKIIDLNNTYIKAVTGGINNRSEGISRKIVRTIIKKIKDFSSKYEDMVISGIEDEKENFRDTLINKSKKEIRNIENYLDEEIEKSISDNLMEDIKEEGIKLVESIIKLINDKFIDETIFKYSYIRGLDGHISDGVHNATSSQFITEKHNIETEHNVSKDYSNPSIGNGQFDYLQRMSKIIQSENRVLKRKGKGQIKAIGILGSDEDDQLLVLQALRKTFPEVIFFTTDLDARHSDMDEIKWTRNLIVASNFGLRLDPSLQDGIPPFRDSYQTSVYFSTLLSLNIDNILSNYGLIELDIFGTRVFGLYSFKQKRFLYNYPNFGAFLEHNTNYQDQNYSFIKPNMFGAKVVDLYSFEQERFLYYYPTFATLLDLNTNYQDQIYSLIKPRIFEIGHHNPCDLSSVNDTTIKGVHTNAILETLKASVNKNHNKEINSIYPDSPRFALDTKQISLLFYIIMFGAILFVTIVLKDFKKNWNIRHWILIACFILLFILLFIATNKYSNYGYWLEPFTIFEGISVWPSELLQIFSIICSGWCLYYGYKKLKANNVDLGKKYFVKKESQEDSVYSKGKTTITGKTSDEQSSDSARPREKLVRLIMSVVISTCFLLCWDYFEKKGLYFYVIWLIPFGFLGWQIIEYQDSIVMNRKWTGSKQGESRYVDTVWKEYRQHGEAEECYFRSSITGISFFLVSVFFMKLFGEMYVPFRGDKSKYIDMVITYISFLLFIFLLFYVVDAARLCVRFVKLVMQKGIEWPEKTRDKFGIIGCLESTTKDYWLNIKLIADRTEAVNKLTYYPIWVILFMFVSYSTYFDNWVVPLSLYIFFGISLSIPILCSFLLRLEAIKAKDVALNALNNELINKTSKFYSPHPVIDQINLLISEIKGIRKGAFVPIFQQPFVKSMIYLFAIIGAVLSQYLSNRY